MVTKAYAHEGFYYMIEGVCHVCLLVQCFCMKSNSVLRNTYMCACVAYICNLHISLYKKIF